MALKRSSIPIEMQVLRRWRWRPRWWWALAAGLLALLMIWFFSRSPGASAPQPSAATPAEQVASPPWRLGNPQGRFTVTLYADLECPFCKAYFPQIKRWVGDNADVALQWHHLPLAAHEPAASTEARLAECAGEAGGPAAFWKAVEWVYAHTRGDGQGFPEGLRYPDLTPAIEQCMASERSEAVIRAQAEESAKGGVTATPSLWLHDREIGKAVLLQGPVEGDALLSAMDMLAAEASATGAIPAEVAGDIPRQP